MPVIPEAQLGGLDGWDPDGLAAAVAAFQAAGCLVLRGAFDAAVLAAARAQFLEGYASYLEDRAHADAACVGDKRFMITVDLAGAFLDARLYANPFLDPLMGEVLGRRYRVAGYGVVASLPGAAAQHVHQDRPSLFGSRVDDFIPAFAVTAIVPMVDMTAETGTTRMWPGSHLFATMAGRTPAERPDLAWADPLAAVGDCLLMDYRLFHCGLANASDQVRPILYLTLARPWFRDDRNFSRQEPVQITAEAIASLPEEHRKLFADVPPGGNRQPDAAGSAAHSAAGSAADSAAGA